MTWPAEHLGAMAILHPGLSVKEHARTAIQLLSHDIPQRRTYAHTGWITSEDGSVYLHAGGAIGSHGAVRDVSIALQGDLQAYLLPDPPGPEPLKAALRASLKILELAPDPITFPLYAAIWLPPCAEADTSLYLAGQTGEGKSELAALAQQHYGTAMDARHLPASWSSSGNALEALAFLAKDALLVIDDFVPLGSTADIQRQHRDADRVLRAQGNHSARQRMRADTSLRPAKPPRGLILSTGEDIPRGHSLRGRMFILELSPGNLRWDRLTACQANARDGLYAQVMASFLQWLAGHHAELGNRWGKELAALRADASVSAMHRRTPEIVANLALSFRTFLTFAYYAGAISQEEQSSLWQRGWKALGETAHQQATYQVASEPTRRFLELLNSAIASGKAHLETPRGSEKPGTDDQLWGWELVTTGTGQNAREDWRPLGPCVGWLDGYDLYLNPDAAYATVQQLGQIGGDGLGVSAQTLWKRMHEHHLLASTDTKRATLKVRRVCAGGNQNVIHITLESLSTHPSPDKPDKDTAKGRVLSGNGVGNSGDSENPTTHPTGLAADNSEVLAPFVGFVGSGDVRELDHLHNGNSPYADATLLSNANSIPTANPTTPPDNAGQVAILHGPTFEERVTAYGRTGMQEQEAIARVVQENEARRSA